MSRLSLARSSILGLSLLFSLAVLPGCGGASRVNPGSQDEAGSVTDQAKEKPSVYTVKPGDTLASIAARPEIYGDKALWPLLVASNQDVLIPGHALAPGTKLLIRRDLSEEDKAVAREQARAHAARAAKARPAAAKPAPASAPQPAQAKPQALPPAQPQAKPQAQAKPAPLPPAAAPAPAPAQPKKGLFLPIILIFVFVLLVALVVLLYVMRRENKG